MKTVHVSELTDAALDWAVAKCEGEDEENTLDPLTWIYTAKPTGCWDFSTDWSQGGPIIERENISTCWEGTIWVATRFNKNCGETWFGHQYGSTPLIAAMRCYVASKLGDEVEIPDELAF